MAPYPRAGQRRSGRARFLLALLAGLIGSLLVIAPAGAQVDEGGDDVEPGGEEPVEPAEPVILQVVDDNADSIQIVEYSDVSLPAVRFVVAVPPALAGDLTESSFAMTENGRVRPLQVAKLQDIIEVVLVIDTSGSMSGDPIDSAKVAAKDFVASLDGDTRLAVVGFGATASTKATFDSSRTEITSAIDDLSADGETTLYDALVLAASEFGDSGSRKFVVVLSDGRDTASNSTLDEAAQTLVDEGINLYAITLASPDADFTGLEALSAQVSGRVVAATDDDSLSDTYSSIASRLTNQYRIEYESLATGDADIIVSVDANGILAIARQTLPLGSTPTRPAVGSLPETGATTDQTDLESIKTDDPLISVRSTNGSLLASADAMYLGAGGLFLGILLVVFIALSTEPRGRSPFERLHFNHKASSPRNGLASIADRASGLADRLLERQSKRGALDSALEMAGMDMRPGEYLMAAAGAAMGMAAFGFVMFGPAGGAIFLVMGALGGRTYVNMKAAKRKKLFGNQLGDTLIMIAGSLRAGHGIVESIDTVASQAEAPTGEEFTRAVAEARIGRDMIESLYDIAARTESEDFIWVVRAISINRELGGDLAEILDNVGDTIRDRNRLRDQVKALSAEGKVSAIILFVLPIGVGGWVQTSNPEYLSSMTDETLGKGVLAFAIFALVVGGLWLKKLVNVEF